MSAIKKEAVKGGWVARNASSGRFREVHTSKKNSHASAKSGEVIRAASATHKDALKRLADR